MTDRDIDKSHLISDAVWEQIEPLLLLHSDKISHPQMDNRKAMETVLYMLRSVGHLRGIQSRSPVYEFLREWRRTGVFDRMWQAGILTYDELRKLILDV